MSEMRWLILFLIFQSCAFADFVPNWTPYTTYTGFMPMPGNSPFGWGPRPAMPPPLPWQQQYNYGNFLGYQNSFSPLFTPNFFPSYYDYQRMTYDQMFYNNDYLSLEDRYNLWNRDDDEERDRERERRRDRECLTCRRSSHRDLTDDRINVPSYSSTSSRDYDTGTEAQAIPYHESPAVSVTPTAAEDRVATTGGATVTTPSTPRPAPAPAAARVAAVVAPRPIPRPAYTPPPSRPLASRSAPVRDPSPPRPVLPPRTERDANGIAIWAPFKNNFDVCAAQVEPSCQPYLYHTTRAENGSCHPQGRAIDLDSISCSTGVHYAGSPVFQKIITCMRKSSLTIAFKNLLTGFPYPQPPPDGHDNHAHISLTCYVQGALKW